MVRGNAHVVDELHGLTRIDFGTNPPDDMAYLSPEEGRGETAVAIFYRGWIDRFTTRVARAQGTSAYGP